MLKKSCAYLLSFLSVSVFGKTAGVDLLDFSIEDLTQVQVSKTVNRYKTSSNESASAVTIITQEEIKRHGYKTLEELLQSVVGFEEAYHIYRPLVSSRGFRQDINSNYLLLIDGHRVNENAYSGFGIEHIFPMMDNIKKVEVIRGPSATLWGGSALNGIIAITTKNATDYQSSLSDSGALEGSVDYEIENQRTIMNATYAKSSKDYDFSLSAIYFDSDTDLSYMYGYGNTKATPFADAQAVYNYEPSYQLYSKMRYKDLHLNMRYSKYKVHSNEQTSTIHNTIGYGEFLNNWIELLYTPKITNTLSLEAKVSGDYKRKLYTEESIASGNNYGYNRY
jgi:iron complex outermembrane receptor protein